MSKAQNTGLTVTEGTDCKSAPARSKKLISSKFFVFLIIISLSTALNYYSDFGFSFNAGVDGLTILWLLTYCIILPISLMCFIRDKTTLKWYIFVSYLLSVFISGIDFFDFNNFRIQGDGATRYFIRIIFFTCIISSFISLTSLVVCHIYQRTKRRKNAKKSEA